MRDILAISKYEIVERNKGNTIGHHTLVITAKKSFWQFLGQDFTVKSTIEHFIKVDPEIFLDGKFYIHSFLSELYQALFHQVYENI